MLGFDEIKMPKFSIILSKEAIDSLLIIFYDVTVVCTVSPHLTSQFLVSFPEIAILDGGVRVFFILFIFDEIASVRKYSQFY